MPRNRQTVSHAGPAPGESVAQYVLRTTRVRIGPFVRHVLAALHGGLWRKRFRSAPRADEVRILRPDGRSLTGRVYRQPKEEATDRAHAPRSGRPAMLVLHGWDPQGQCHGLYLALADALVRRGWIVLTVNLPGYPGSDAPNGPAGYDLAELESAALTALDDFVSRDDVDDRRLVLLGHSYGAGLVIPMLKSRPSVPRAIIYGPSIWVTETTTGPDATHRAFYHERYWRYMDGVPPVPMSEYLALMEDIYIPAQVGALPEGHAPILLLDGADEKQEALAFSAYLHEILPPPCEYWSIPHTDHFCNAAVIGGVLIEDRAAIERLAKKIVDWCGW